MAKKDVKEDVILDTLKDDSDQEADKTDSSPVDSKESKAEETKPKLEAESKDKAEEPEGKDKGKEPKPPEETDTEEDGESPEEPEPDKPADEDKPTKAEERKQQLNTEIRDLVSTRNALKTEVEKANAEVYQPAAENELTDQTNPETGQPYTSVEAKVESMRQAQEMDKYNYQVAEAQLTIASESQRVLTDFPQFRRFELGTESIDPKTGEETGTPNPLFEEELALEAAQLLNANLIHDPNTQQVIGSNVSPYQLYKTLDRATGISTTKGQLQGREDAEQMAANVDQAGGIAPPKKAEDPVLAILRSDDD